MASLAVSLRSSLPPPALLVDDDHALLVAWQAGDADAGGRLFERYFDALYRFFRGKVDGGVEDLVQETFLSCVRVHAAIDPGVPFRAYLYRVARSRLYDRLRRGMRRGAEASLPQVSLADLAAGPSARVAQLDELRLLGRALAHLPLELHLAIELFYFEEMPASQVAVVLHIPEGTVRSRLRRAVQLLRRQIESMARTPHAAARSLRELDGWVR